jgi:hypothetical protein
MGVRQAAVVMSAILVVLAALAVGGVGYTLLSGEAEDYAKAIAQHEAAERAVVNLPQSIDCVALSIAHLADVARPTSPPLHGKGVAGRVRPSPPPRSDDPAAAKRCGNAVASRRSR